jgi:ferric-dicitrate binding protein FerR (iron transport regulator)
LEIQRIMIAHIRQSKQPESATPIMRARHMVAETLLPDEPARPRRRAAMRKILLCSGLAVLAVLAALAYYLSR